MTRPLIILGASGNALDIMDVVDAINSSNSTWQLHGILDDTRPAESSFAGHRILGPLCAASNFDKACFVIAIGSDRSFRQRPRIVACTGLPLTRFVTLIHPLAAVSPRAKVGAGICVNAGCSVAGNVAIGNHVSMGPGSIVGHDSVIGDHTILAPASVVSGSCEIGPGCYIGAGAVIRQRVRIGSGALVGMGAVVLRDVDSGDVVVGNPARVLEPAFSQNS